MSARARLISFAVVAIAVIGVLVWKCRGDAPEPPKDASVVVPMTKARLKLRDLARQKPGTVRGKVSGDGGAIAGALVCRRPSEDLEDIRCVSTDRGGAYELADLRPGAYQIWASAIGFAGARWRDRDGDKLTLKAGEAKAGIDLVLGRGTGEIAGRVRDTRGQAVKGALIHVRVDGEPVGTARTEDDGGFRARVEGTAASVEAIADGYVEESVQTIVPAAGIEIVLLPEATLSGIVVETGTKTPVPDARVWLDGTRVTSADDGTFRATKLRPGRYKPVASSIGGYGEAAESVLLRVGSHVEGVVIEVHPVAVVAGRIAIEGSTKGCPEGDGAVQLERRGSREFAFGNSIVDGDVLIEGVVPGTYQVRVHCAGYIAEQSYPDLPVGGTDVEDIVWTVKPGATVTGRVTAKGAPVADALVSINGGFGHGARVRTEADGTFKTSGMPIGELSAEAGAVGYASSEQVKVTTSLASTARVELVLGDKTGTIAGVVVDRSGKPVTNQRVEVRSGTATAGPNASTDLRGEFTIQGIEPGTYSVVAESKWQEGSSSARVIGTPVRVTVARDVVAKVQLQIDTDDARITGTVVDAAGQPIADVAIDVALTGPEVEPRRRDYERALTWTSASGAFEVTGLPDHALAVRARIEGANEVVVDNVQPGQHVRLVLEPTGVLAGTVSDPSGASVDDIFLEIEDRAQDISRKERLFHTGGKFAFRELPAGTYRLTADEDRQTSITVTIGDGEKREDLQLALRPRHAIKGRLVNRDGKPLANWKIEVPHKEAVDTSSNGRVVATYETEYASTNARGEFLMEGLVGAEVTISAGDLSKGPEPDMVDVKTVPLVGPPTIDLGDLSLPPEKP